MTAVVSGWRPTGATQFVKFYIALDILRVVLSGGEKLQITGPLLSFCRIGNMDLIKKVKNGEEHFVLCMYMKTFLI